MKTHYKLKEKLVQQAMAEIAFDVDYRRKRDSEWKKNEQLMKAYAIADDETKSKVPLFQAISFEETLLSKIDNSLVFKFTKGGLEDKRKAEKFNALRERDAKVGRWDKKDRMGKRHGIRYGRAIFLYASAGSLDGYDPELSNIRPRNFHIDPDCGNDKEKARHLGWWGVSKTKKQLLDGIKSGRYDKKATEALINTGSNYSDQSQEDQSERQASANPDDVAKSKKMANENVWLFYQHFTIDYDTDERYILLLTKSGECIRCEPWKDSDVTEMYPIWSYATSPDDSEWWSISPLERVRRMFKAMEKSINQMLDNADRVNKPKLAINVDFIKNLAQAKYGTGGFLEITGNTDVDKAVKAILTPSIETPLKVFDKLQMIVDRESGVTAQAAGVSDEDGVLGIYDGNKENLGDRLGLLNKEYSEGYYDFAVLYKNYVKQNLTSKVAIEILGPNGIGIEEITWADLKPTKHDYDILIESSAAEQQMNKAQTDNKLEVLTGAKEDPLYNQTVVREKTLELTGFNDDDKRALLDTKDGSEGMLVRAYEDFEKLVLGKEVIVPRNANLHYAMSLNDLWQDRDDMIQRMYKSNPQKATDAHQRIQDFLDLVEQKVMKNEAENTMLDQANMEMEMAKNGGGVGGGKPLDPTKMVDPEAIGNPTDIPLTDPSAVA